MAYAPEQEIAHLKRANAALTDLIARMERGKADEGDWLIFYDAMSFVSGLEDAAADCAADCRRELNLDEEGWPLDDNGIALPDDGYGFTHHRCIPPLKAIPAKGMAA